MATAAAPLDVSSQQDLAPRVVRAFAWKGASRALLESSKIVVGIILARTLTPTDYGIAGMVLVFAGLIPIFSGLALGSALVQRPEIDEADRSTAFWAGLGFGLALAAAGIGLSWPIASFYGEPQVQPLLAVLSLSFIVTALGMTQGQLLVRSLSYRALELRTMAGTLVGAAVGIGAALAGLGPWALILQLLAATAIATALLWLFSPWRPRFIFSMTSLRSMAGFGGNVSGALVLNEVNSNADNLLIGRFIGADALGQYAVAYNVMLVPFSRVTSPLQEVLYAAFSRVQDDLGYVRKVWLRVNRLVASIAAPALAGLVLLAPDVVSVVIGDQWLPAVPVIRILACVGLIQALQGLNASVLLATGRAGTYLHFTAISVCANLAAFVLGLHWGITGVAACFAVSMVILQPFYTRLAAKAVGSSLREFIWNFRGVAVATAVMTAAVGAVDIALRGQELPPFAHLLSLSSLGFVVYASSLLLFAPDVARDARSALRRLRP